MRAENCSFGYECPLLLENLPVSEHTDNVRNCDKCHKEVYIVNTAEQIKFQISLGRCVAFRAVRPNVFRHTILIITMQVQLRQMLMGDVI